MTAKEMFEKYIKLEGSYNSEVIIEPVSDTLPISVCVNLGSVGYIYIYKDDNRVNGSICSFSDRSLKILLVAIDKLREELGWLDE